jgi:hypothetical protein
MDYNNLDPKLVEKAKQEAAGPLGREMTKFPLRFAKAVFFENLPDVKSGHTVNNGTVTLVDLGSGQMAITCSHVLDGYRERLKENNKVLFRIGKVILNPLEHLIDESPELDLATINLREININEISLGKEIGTSFFDPVTWPPSDVKVGDYIAFGGFPGKLREQTSSGDLIFGSLSNGASEVSSVNYEYFICQFEREYWVESLGIESEKDLHELGGISGGPVFLMRENNGIMSYEFVGIIYQFSTDYDLLYIRKAKFINKDGSISQN